MQEKLTSKKKNPQPTDSEEKEMSFWDHLEELRMHIFRSLAAIIIFAIVAFLFKGIIFDMIILAPKDSDFITNRLLCQLGQLLSVDALCMDEINLVLQNINMSGQFMMHMYVSFIAGLIIAMPYVLWEMWRFIMPALETNEKKYSQGGVLISSLLFLIGVLFSYFVIVPLTINFLGTYQVSDTVANQIQLNSYVSTVVSVTIAVGIVFELPILIYFLTKIGIVTPQLLRKSRKVMLVIVLVLSAIITPPDIFSQVLVSLPLLGLYEISIRISERLYKKQQAELVG